MDAGLAPGLTIWTVGHSTRSGAEFATLLKGAGVEAVADVRRWPRSRRHPQFNEGALRATLAEAGIGYRHLPELGGRREARPDSQNTAWRAGGGFRGYADYMETPEFEGGLARLLELASGRRVAIMCAEGSWRECHRGLIADALKARGVRVVHLRWDGAAEEHPYTRGARVEGGTVRYDTGDQSLPWRERDSP